MGYFEVTDEDKDYLEQGLTIAKILGYDDLVDDINYLLDLEEGISERTFQRGWNDAMESLGKQKARLNREMEYLETDVVSQIEETVQNLNVSQKEKQAITKKITEILSKKRMGEIKKELRLVQKIDDAIGDWHFD